MNDILFEKRENVMIVTFNRPSKGNALNAAMANLLKDQLSRIQNDPDIRVVLLRGEGENFMNGHDYALRTVDITTIREATYQKIFLLHDVIRTMNQMKKLVVAAVDGCASGAGLSFALASDVVIATTDAVFRFEGLSRARLPDAGVTYYLPRKVGIGRAHDLLLIGKDVSANLAAGWGLVSRVVPRAELENESLAMAQKLAELPTKIAGEAKKLINISFDHDLSKQLALELASWNTTIRTNDFQESVMASREKRPVKFTGN